MHSVQLGSPVARLRSRTAEIADIVERVVVELAVQAGVDASVVHMGASLVNDVGMDSLMFVDLMIDLEDALGIDGFPLQRWLDEQSRVTSGVPYSLASLVELCVELLVDDVDGQEGFPC